MDTTIVAVLIWAAAICSGLMAGVYLAFSGFIMRSLASLEVGHAIAAMNSINVVIVRSSFMLLFSGSTLVLVLLFIAGIWQWGSPGSYRAILAGTVYVTGMFFITAICNVPLNDALAGSDGNGAAAQDLWQKYLVQWTRWNTARAVACITTLLVCMTLIADF
jgi:uncharacterized membrane protein